MTDFESGLARVILAHRRCRAVNYGGSYECVCGESVVSNSHHAQSRHIAEKVVAYISETAKQTLD